MIRRIGAVTAGYLTIAVVPMLLWIWWPEAPRHLPLTGLLILSLLIGIVAAATGGAVTAALDPAAPIRAAAGLALTVVVLEVIAAPFSVPGNPRWYDVSALLTGVGGIMVGGVGWSWVASQLRARRVVRLYEGLFSDRSAYSQEDDSTLTDRGRPGA